MQCAKILLEPAKFNALDKYIKSKWEESEQSEESEESEDGESEGEGYDE
jgi:hypothetical protein